MNDTTPPSPRKPTDPLDEAVVQDWAIGTLQEWLQGYTSPQEDVPTQYRVRLQSDGTFTFEPVTSSGTIYELPTQRFRIDISVTELRGDH